MPLTAELRLDLGQTEAGLAGAVSRSLGSKDLSPIVKAPVVGWLVSKGSISAAATVKRC